jgi:hypothetical protein
MHKHYEHGFHAMLNFHNLLDVAGKAVEDITSWVREKVDS